MYSTATVERELSLPSIQTDLSVSSSFSIWEVKQRKSIDHLLKERYPTLIDRIRKVIEQSEFEYADRKTEDSFLWEHTYYVASMAMKLSYDECIDPLLPVVTALFHDCGKFENGNYHAGDIPEEAIAATIAEKLLEEIGFHPVDTKTVIESLLSLYNDQREKSRISKIVHDADFLIKFGFMGFANFFERSVLRGMTIRHSILKTMSKELTYAACLEQNMYTASGKKRARAKAEESTWLFRNYLKELEETGIAEYEIREVDLDCCKGPEAITPLVLVLPKTCCRCNASMKTQFDRERGIKCERLIVKIGCSCCSEKSDYDFSFCLPELMER